MDDKRESKIIAKINKVVEEMETDYRQRAINMLQSEGFSDEKAKEFILLLNAKLLISRA